MIETRAKTYSVVSNQIPEQIRSESPLFGEFLQQYYKSQEAQGAPIDLAENLDQYIKNDSFRQQDLVKSTNLDGAITAFDTTIAVNSTVGFPDRYGYLKIDNEIITYTSKDKRQFFDCNVLLVQLHLCSIMMKVIDLHLLHHLLQHMLMIV